MRIVVNHLTRMRRGYICVAGINLATGEHVRPIPRNGHLRYNDLAAHGGLFEIGQVLELGWTKSIGKPPEIEDQEFGKRSARISTELPAAEFWSRLKGTAKSNFIGLFGRDLQPAFRRTTALAIAVGSGTDIHTVIDLMRSTIDPRAASGREGQQVASREGGV